MKKFTPSINWKYAFGEVFLIFLGITAALYFNNWNESRKRASLEKETLLEIREGIQADLEDIKDNIQGYSFRRDCYQKVIGHLEEKRPLTEGFLDTVQYLRGFTFFISNTGPYETLKSRGLGLISNKEIRLAIAKYYDQRHEWIKVSEDKHHFFYNNQLTPVLLRYFDGGQRFKPYRYEALLADKEAHQAFHWFVTDIFFLIRQYNRLAEEAESLLAAIDEELR